MEGFQKCVISSCCDGNQRNFHHFFGTQQIASRSRSENKSRSHRIEIRFFRKSKQMLPPWTSKSKAGKKARTFSHSGHVSDRNLAYRKFGLLNCCTFMDRVRIRIVVTNQFLSLFVDVGRDHVFCVPFDFLASHQRQVAKQNAFGQFP